MNGDLVLRTESPFDCERYISERKDYNGFNKHRS